jgi:competence protein ComEA
VRGRVVDAAGVSTLRSWLRSAADALAATPTEIAGLAACLVCAAAGTVVLLWLARPVPLATAAGGPPADAGPVFEVTGDGAGAGGDAAAGSQGPVVVHVAGAVLRPGVVTLAAGARVADALAAAGGAGPGADLSALNLARTVGDGEQVVVPLLGAAGTSAAAAGEHGGPGAAEGRLDLNRATAAELESLPGIGPVLAQRIVDSREAEGPFAAVGDLRRVSGIGERVLAGVADLVVVR